MVDKQAMIDEIVLVDQVLDPRSKAKAAAVEVELMEKIVPDREAILEIEREHPRESPAEKYRLAQAATLIRLTKAESPEELRRMAEVGLLKDLIADHNRKQRG
jgi:hypothetical protein